MEQATTSLPRAVPAARAKPPGSRAPATLQALRYAGDPLGFFAGLQRRYGDVFSVAFPYFGRVVYVADPGFVKAIFGGDAATFRAGEANATVLEPALGPYSVLTLDEDEHMRQRKLLLPPFHGKSVSRYGDLIREITEADMETWPVGRAFALRPHTQRITLAVILRAVFGVTEGDRLERASALVDEFARRADLVTKLPFLRRRLGRFSPWNRFLAARAELDEFIYEEIAARRAADDAACAGGASSDRDDVLSLLLRAVDDEGRAMSDQELRDELVTVVGAGHETTATALAWAIERLLRNPRALERLRASIAADEDEYLDAVIKETLRVRPVIVDVARKLAGPAEVAGYELPAGTFVLPAIAALHYREDLYPEPREFRPERFLEDGADHFAWIPFGGGVRRCVGAAFAQYEMRVVLRTMLERAELSAPDPRPERPKARNITLAPADDTRVELRSPLAAGG